MNGAGVSALPLNLILLSVAIAFAASYVHSAIGLGFGMLATATMTLYLSPVYTAAVLSLCITVLGVIMVVRLWGSIDWKLAMPPAIGMLLGKVFGVVALMRLQTGSLKRMLGVVLIAFFVYFLFFEARFRIKPTPAKGFGLGILSGILGGLYNLAGPFVAIYFFPSTCDKYVYSASMNFAFLPAAVLGLLLHWWYGNLTPALWATGGLCSIAVAGGVFAGLATFRLFNRALLQRILYAYMALIGLYTIIVG